MKGLLKLLVFESKFSGPQKVNFEIPVVLDNMNRNVKKTKKNCVQTIFVDKRGCFGDISVQNNEIVIPPAYGVCRGVYSFRLSVCSSVPPSIRLSIQVLTFYIKVLCEVFCSFLYF